MAEPSITEVREKARSLGISPLSGPGVTKKSLQKRIDLIEKGSNTRQDIYSDNPWLYDALDQALPDIPDPRGEDTRKEMGPLNLWELAKGEIEALTEKSANFFASDNILSLNQKDEAQKIMADYPILSYAVAKNRDWWWSIPFLEMTRPHPSWPPYASLLNDLITNERREWLKTLYKEKKEEEDIDFLLKKSNFMREKPLYEYRRDLILSLKESIQDIRSLLSLIDTPEDLHNLLSANLSEEEVLEIISNIRNAAGRKRRRYDFLAEIFSSPIVLHYWKESPSFVAEIIDRVYDMNKLDHLWKERPAYGSEEFIVDKIMEMRYLYRIINFIHLILDKTPFRPVITLILLFSESINVYNEYENKLFDIVELLDEDELIIVAYWFNLLPKDWIPSWLTEKIKDVNTDTYKPPRSHVDRIVKSFAHKMDKLPSRQY